MPRCPQCGAFGRLSAAACEKCGSALPRGTSVEERLAAIDSRVNEGLARIDQLTSGGRAQGMPLAAKPQEAAEEKRSLLPETEHFICSGAHEPRQAWGFITANAFIENNFLYKERAGSISLHYEANELQVNAYATESEVMTGAGDLLPPPVIVIQRGLLHGICIGAAGIAVGLMLDTRPLIPEVFREIGQTIVAAKGSLDLEPVWEIHKTRLGPLINQQTPDDWQNILSMAQSIRLSAYLYVNAHEAGHIALAHTLGRRPNLETSRNQEREADSFASSVLSTCPYREYHILGQMAAITMFVWFHEAAGSPGATTHPDAFERFANAFATNSRAAHEAEQRFGLGREDFESWLPNSEV